MRITDFSRAAIGRRLASSATALATMLATTALGAVVLASAAATPAMAETPSLAQAISYEAADVWEPRAGASPAAGAGASAEASLIADPAVVPCDDCQECNGDGSGGGYFYNRCGCSTGLFPYFTGPGGCDNWCVGPHWEVALDGLIMSRENADWAAVPPGAGFTADLIDQFGEGPGARLFVTGYNENNYGIQVGYEGINDFHSNALFSNAGGDARSITYESNFNSIEVNFVRRTQARWRPFAGVRYIEMDDDFVDFTTVARVIPPPSNPPAPPAAFIDSGSAFLIENRLIGVQGGAFRDVWRLNRWVTIEPFGNGGVYLNDFKREQIDTSVTTIITGDDLSTPANEFFESSSMVQTSTIQEFSELSFVGEVGVTGVFRLNRCVALRAGYQVLVMDQVGQGLDALLSPGVNPTSLVYHGGHFGLEYVR